ncbi:hypothetical protein Fmac_009935 [Flemingia macrophylla]|uniref:C2H2-type domain-containing protein n=1 Tax=Flemingia macrophylla TaxID=520843 RepID=A0ABD1N1N7_9FABA
MLEVWLSLKKTLQCKPDPNQVHDPKTITIRQQKGNQRTKSGNLESSNTKDSIQGSKRHSKNQPSFKGDIDITHPITHEIVLIDSSNSEICPCCPRPQSSSDSKTRITSSKMTNSLDYNEANVSSNRRMLLQMDSDGFSTLICHTCGEKLKNLDSVEAHHISEHSVTELEEDSSRQIIETICGTNSVKSENMLGKIDCILRVLNVPKTFACFEEYREVVKDKAEKLQKKHPRCVVDGNELLRFHGTTIACSLGTNSSYSLCSLDYCGVCQILRHGFSTKNEFRGALGVYTTSTSAKAFDSISIMTSHERPFPRKSVLVCRVIAGRVYSPIEEIEEKVGSEFDSLAEKIDGHSDVEELYVLNPKALLPCFVVIFKQQTAKARRFNSSFRISSF